MGSPSTITRPNGRTEKWNLAIGAVIVCVASGSCSAPETVGNTTQQVETAAPRTRVESTSERVEEPPAGISPVNDRRQETVTGTFTIDNTSAGGDGVLVEAMRVIVELRLVASDEWRPVAAECTIEPPAPVEVSEQLAVSYECELDDEIPDGEDIRVVAEATIFGSDEVFRLEGTA